MKKVVLITGASSGMGKETVKVLLKAGYIVYGAARRVEKMADLKQLGANIIKMDVTDDEAMVKAVNGIITAEGRIDVLINNAGFGSYGAIEDVPINDAKYQLDVNVFGAARLSQLVLPHMRKQHWGKIVNISSIGGKFAMPLGGWYHARKFALEALSDSMRIEVKQFGIDVIVIEPGGVKSEWSGIAMDNAMKVSGNTEYAEMAKKFTDAGRKMEDKGAEPIVIARLIERAIKSKSPKTRYSGGFMAAPLLLMKKLLPDRLMDRLFLSQLK